jgi:hypothetical protein
VKILERHRPVSFLVQMLLVALCAATLVSPPAPAQSATKASIAAYRGLGSWVDIYDTAQFDHPVATVKAMKRRGVRTLFLETGNYTRGPIYRPESAARFIHAAHRRNMKVVAWYLPSFSDPDVDFDRAMASVRFRTSRGQRFDGFGLDIEATNVDDISVRIQRMLALSRRIRNAVGESYPLGAIVPSPFGMKRVPGYWGPVRDFPWAELARIYDVIVPMSYFSYRVDGMRAAYEYNAFNVRLIRQESGRPDVPIHLIGGIAGDTSRRETRGYVRAVRTFGTPGGSYYGFDSTTRGDWRELKQIPVNPRQSPPLPIPLDDAWTAPVGNVPGADRTHPKEVFFRVGPRSEPLLLSFEAFDIDAGEVRLQVNWRSMTELRSTPEREWGRSQQVRIPGWRFDDKRANVISFVARGKHPDWNIWGVRNIVATRAP